MGIQHSTENDAELAAMRSVFLVEHRLRDYRLSAYHLMRMVRDATTDRDVIDRVRKRFTPGGWLQWPGSAFDHMECLGRDRVPLMFVSHPYSIGREGEADIDLLWAGGLRVAIEGKERSWYGFGTHHVRIEHPEFSGPVVRPAPLHAPALPASPSARIVAETTFEARLRHAGPRLLALAKERAAELDASSRLIACTGPRGLVPCLACELREDFQRIVALIDEIECP